jgi:hypothetical protein
MPDEEYSTSYRRLSNTNFAYEEGCRVRRAPKRLKKTQKKRLKTPRKEGNPQAHKTLFVENLHRLLERRKVTPSQFAQSLFGDDPRKRKWFLRLAREGVSKVHKETLADLEEVAKRLGVELAEMWLVGTGAKVEDHRHRYWRYAEKLLDLLDGGHRYLFDLIDHLYCAHIGASFGEEASETTQSNDTPPTRRRSQPKREGQPPLQSMLKRPRRTTKA